MKNLQNCEINLVSGGIKIGQDEYELKDIVIYSVGAVITVGVMTLLGVGTIYAAVYIVNNYCTNPTPIAAVNPAYYGPIIPLGGWMNN